MMFDRTLLILAVLSMLAMLMKMPSPIQQAFALGYGVRALRSQRMTRRSAPVSPSRTNTSSTARASSIA